MSTLRFLFLMLDFKTLRISRNILFNGKWWKTNTLQCITNEQIIIFNIFVNVNKNGILPKKNCIYDPLT